MRNSSNVLAIPYALIEGCLSHPDAVALPGEIAMDRKEVLSYVLIGQFAPVRARAWDLEFVGFELGSSEQFLLKRICQLRCLLFQSSTRTALRAVNVFGRAFGREDSSQDDAWKNRGELMWN